MLELTEEETRNRNFDRLLVYCDADAQHVHTFYRKNGFRLLVAAKALSEAHRQAASPDDKIFVKALSLRHGSGSNGRKHNRLG